MVIRDRLKLSAISVELKVSSYAKCFSYTSGFLQRELGPSTAAASWTRNPARCGKCGRTCVSPHAKGICIIRLHRDVTTGCPVVEWYYRCKKSIRQCPGCGELLNQWGQPVKAITAHSYNAAGGSGFALLVRILPAYTKIILHHDVVEFKFQRSK